MKTILPFTLLVVAPFVLDAQPKHPLTFDDFIGIGRLTDPQVSPDGKSVAFVVTKHDKVENKTNSNIYLVPIEGGEMRQLTMAKAANYNPRWMPDGSSIAFVSTRDGESQIWSVPLAGGEARKLSTISTGASGLIVSPDGRWLAFNSEVYPDCPNDDCNKERSEQVEKSKVKAKIFDRLPYRVWNSWKDGKRSHVFVMPFSGGAAVDVTPGDYDTPPIDLGGHWDYAFSPDGKELAFARNVESNIATSTNNDLFVVPVAGGAATRITDNPANDSQPSYSPDGRYLAYRRMNRPGFEADLKQLVLYERSTGKHMNLTEKFDYSVDEVIWSPDGGSIFFNAEDKGNVTIFRLSLKEKKIEAILQKGYNRSLGITPDGKALVFLKESINKPAEVCRIDVAEKSVKQLTSINLERLANVEMNVAEEFWFEGAGRTKIHGFLVKPPGFDPSKKYPMVYLIHGGPQSQWGDMFHYRWNAQMFASRGNVVVLVNPRGSSGYGQKLTDEISKDWGGRAYEDLMRGVDYVVKSYSYVDGKRLAAAGASYGGYMISWLATRTDRFKCLVNHDGVFNPVSMYGTTEELWFPEWEFGGTPYGKPELYKKWSPLEHASKFKTPMLVVHGQLDYRVDVSEGFQLFTALQRQGVKSKMLYFPDEGHFVTKPANAEFWYKTVLDWIDEHVN